MEAILTGDKAPLYRGEPFAGRVALGERPAATGEGREAVGLQEFEEAFTHCVLHSVPVSSVMVWRLEELADHGHLIGKGHDPRFVQLVCCVGPADRLGEEGASTFGNAAPEEHRPR